jgi:hypothetical protein
MTKAYKYQGQNDFDFHLRIGLMMARVNARISGGKDKSM